MMRKLIGLFICFIVLLTSCVQETKDIQTARILISGGHGSSPCIIEVFANGLIETTTGDLSLSSSNGSLNSDGYFGENRKQKSQKLSKANREIIDNLITGVKKNCISTNEYKPIVDDAIMVNAVIDDVEYSCLYEIGYMMYNDDKNEDLRNLAHKLVEVSPLAQKAISGQNRPLVS